jgi:hypothetical protein
MFEEAAALNGLTLEDILNERAPAAASAREAAVPASPAVSEIDGLEGLFSPEDEGGGLPSPPATPSEAEQTDEGADSSSDEEDGQAVAEPAKGVPAQSQQVPGRAAAEPPAKKAKPAPPQEAAAETPEQKAQAPGDDTAAHERAEKQLALPNSVTHPREYKNFLRQLQARHLSHPILQQQAKEDKASLFAKFIALDCDLKRVAGEMVKELERATPAPAPHLQTLPSGVPWPMHAAACRRPARHEVFSMPSLNGRRASPPRSDRDLECIARGHADGRGASQLGNMRVGEHGTASHLPSRALHPPRPACTGEGVRGCHRMDEKEADPEGHLRRRRTQGGAHRGEAAGEGTVASRPGLPR